MPRSKSDRHRRDWPAKDTVGSLTPVCIHCCIARVSNRRRRTRVGGGCGLGGRCCVVEKLRRPVAISSLSSHRQLSARIPSLPGAGRCAVADSRPTAACSLAARNLKPERATATSNSIRSVSCSSRIQAMRSVQWSILGTRRVDSRLCVYFSGSQTESS